MKYEDRPPPPNYIILTPAEYKRFQEAGLIVDGQLVVPKAKDNGNDHS